MTEKISISTVIRTVLLVLALVNQILVMTGHSVLPISDEQVEQAITLIFTMVTAIIAWWKNNSVTQKAIQADQYLAELKDSEKGTTI